MSPEARLPTPEEVQKFKSSVNFKNIMDLDPHDQTLYQLMVESEFGIVTIPFQGQICGLQASQERDRLTLSFLEAGIATSTFIITDVERDIVLLVVGLNR
ncbi:hypothetical protein A2715_00365 [Candidatus Woesebacteria bacterium RIFCSPHIGHO2_01_FULL_39_32]|uniref:Uncharacterized protein n=2 Tax=Candidatus Woeseibacteriota TaxID=1752722 RepID=A0A0G0S7B7_9BACT|nr:MAG: hypothetical protein UT61_C0004G0052 [Candidatus Woesebacteria bacterium GW2011_GWA1_39_8]OGM03596.1 MAG: hypothetical protein A2124_01685 [Candidatus Woesebacteria bacterium GWB1_37_5]OGM24279.1 MAG: hypothetical protein A2715_00365 [Candidatus Woesebacteria bacterium RIFCSPHIGHO2_01_FULL_39_32]OGM35406.1 MAG: hypothetical protein A3F01_04720 [Candidatus Woesebacteria bacterium RIFCSPHIGHO2_12_FULL_38_11]OGM65350.1 MAG: hypothetical protein A2893_01320 [Candidatus Woesebacteria bacteri